MSAASAKFIRRRSANALIRFRAAERTDTPTKSRFFLGRLITYEKVREESAKHKGKSTKMYGTDRRTY